MAKKDNNDPPEDDNLPDDFFGDEEDGDEEDGDGEEENEFMDEFDSEEPSEEDKRDFEKERKERQNKITGHPVYKQAEEVYRMTEALVASMQPKSKEEDYDEAMANLLMQSATIICPKLAGAIGSENYTIAMQNAAIIRDNAEY
ncbi:MAG: hypothetical protein IAF38_09490, partial [Bacteroidia bacterium]|nr:hypothetical protein [Bacteroidia bacterium]